ncbi:FkbM family methyltransferase [Flavobacterium sp. MC2016-06]|jgi:FkbM family methyltransferase|uniref:FkbM family methyltransferase n=1 Tax=Flavobacterium sp. MC2016-06 TaxID=2676308 RepID=UPI0012BAA04F|nr:FkbM family methyltransferase [Flavobacterium sp. MC2016-06]MBU3858659.1 FkbM family methyltransferase [Flavobacterium sp. MC2016-06]
MKLKKLKKIYRILFPLKISVHESFVNNLLSNHLIKEVQKNDNLFFLKIKNDLQLYLRDENHSDYSVFNQIFKDEEYKTVSSILKNNEESSIYKTVLIDAGANVGYATIYLNHIFNFDKIICIEPSKSNFELLKKNIDLLNSSKTNEIVLLENALAARKDLSFTIANDFRDGKDWSITTLENKVGNIKGITLNEIIEKNNLDEITILKIDIEGAERFIFEKTTNLSFLNMTKIIVIEIHDEFNIRKEIYQILRDNNFLLIESGEVTIGVNKNLY